MQIFLSGLLLSSLLLSGCGLLYTNVRVPRAYRSPTPADVKNSPTDETVSGEVCNYSILFLVAWGNSGYADAIEKALQGKPNAVLYDVKVDVKARTILLGLYTRVCTVVTGKVGQLGQ